MPIQKASPEMQSFPGKRRISGSDAGELEKLGNLGFPAEGHDVDALAIGLALADNARGNFYTRDSGLGLFLVSLKFGDKLVGDMDSGDVLVHELTHSGVLRDDDTDLNRLTELLCLLHELDELLGLKHCLSLEVLSACHDLALHLDELSINGIAARGNNSALGEGRSIAVESIAAEVKALFELGCGIKQRHGVKVKDRLGLRVITELGVVAGEGKDVVNAKHGGAQKIGLQGDAVTIAAGHLENGVESGVLEDLAGSEGTETHNGGLVIRNVDGVDAAEVSLGFLNQIINVYSLRRADFCGNRKYTIVEIFSNFHYSPLLD